VVVVSASGLKNMEVVGEQDPYCRVSFGSTSKKTAVVSRGGSDPVWSEEAGTVLLPVSEILAAGSDQALGELSLLSFEIFDKDRGPRDDFVGEASLWLEAVGRRCLQDGVRSWRGEVQVFRRGIKGRGKLLVEVFFRDSHLDLLRSQDGESRGRADELLEATPTKVHKNLVPGIVQAIQEGDATRFNCFMTYQVALQQTQEIFGDSWNYGRDGQHPDTFAEDAKGRVIRSALSALHHQLYYDEIGGASPKGIRTEVKLLAARSSDFVRLIQQGIREERRRVFTYVLTDSGWFFSETGAALSKDNLSKHAIHSDAAMAVRYAGTFRICERDSGAAVLVIDNDSGTYMPKGEHQESLKRLLHLNLGDLEVLCLNVCDPQPEWTKELSGPNEKKGIEKAVYAGTWEWK